MFKNGLLVLLRYTFYKLFLVLPQKPLAERNRKEKNQLPTELYAQHHQLRYLDHSFDNMRRYLRYEHFQHLQYDQRLVFVSWSFSLGSFCS